MCHISSEICRNKKGDFLFEFLPYLKTLVNFFVSLHRVPVRKKKHNSKHIYPKIQFGPIIKIFLNHIKNGFAALGCVSLLFLAKIIYKMFCGFGKYLSCL